MKKLILVIVGILIIWGLVALAQHEWDTTTYAALVEEEDAVLLVDQDIEGEETVVSYAKLSQPGYVVIYGSNAAGEQVVLGSSELLPAGEHRFVRVRRGSSFNARKDVEIVAKIVHDDGDEEFDETEDVPAVDEDGEEIISEAELDEDLEPVDELATTDEELAELLDDEGYEVNEEALTEESDDLGGGGLEDEMSDNSSTTDDASMEEATSTDETTMDDGAATTTEAEVEAEAETDTTL